MSSEIDHNTSPEPSGQQRTEPGDATKDSRSDGDRDGTNSTVVTASKEIGGRNGPDPVRYGDWEKKGRCIDF